MNPAEQTAPPPAKPRPGDRLELTLESWGRLGEAMAWHDGFPIFVFGGIPGERVTAEITRVHRQYAAAAVTQVSQPSPDRVPPPCPYFGPCTGCQWQHLDYNAQLTAKREKIIDALIRIGGLFPDAQAADATVVGALPSPNPYAYRNHARFTIGPPTPRRKTPTPAAGQEPAPTSLAGNTPQANGESAHAPQAGMKPAHTPQAIGESAHVLQAGMKPAHIPPASRESAHPYPAGLEPAPTHPAGEPPTLIPPVGGELKGGQLGFINRETRRFVRIDYCMLMRPAINAILQKLQDRCQETTQLSIRAGAPENPAPGEYLVQPPLHNPAIPIPTGQKRYIETIDQTRFFVSSPSFFQVNVAQAAQAAQVIRDHLSLTPDDILLDAYTGVGTFAILLAPHVSQVIAIEESAAAVTDAQENAANANAPNIQFIVGRTETALTQLPIQPDAVILDPPRSGCQPQALEKLAQLSPPRLAYVSCDPETLARDLKILCNANYTLTRIIPIDMFPQTHHIESVAILHHTPDHPEPVAVPPNHPDLVAALPDHPERVEGPPPPQTLTLASASPRRRELMTALGLPFRIQPADIPENPLPNEPPQDMVERLSREKALKVAASLPDGLVIGADSTVIHRGQAIGKPRNDREARNMLRRLRNTTHHVCTGLTVTNAATGQTLTTSQTSQITLRNFSDAEIEASIAAGTPQDKAGAYAIQDTALRPAAHWQGCYPNIVGLPTCRLLEMLHQLNWPPPPHWQPPTANPCSPGCPNLSKIPSPSGGGLGWGRTQ